MCIHNSAEISFNRVISINAINTTLVNNKTALTGSNAHAAVIDSVNQKYYREIHVTTDLIQSSKINEN